MVDICCIGHITLDKIITPDNEFFLNGGTSYYFTHAIHNLGGINYRLITSMAEKDAEEVEAMRRKGINVTLIPSPQTVYFENKYEHNMNNRRQRVLAKAQPFTVESLKDIEAKFIHLGSLLADDFSPEVIRSLQGKGIVSVDAQGFLRHVEGESVVSCDWKDKLDIFPYIDILKVNEHEIKSLTGYSDPREAGRQLNEWGIKEVLITLGNYGSVIFAEGRFYDIPAYTPSVLVDATGCGDTYAAGYLYMRSLGENYRECGKFAAAVSTLKLERSGAFNGTLNDVRRVMSISL